MSPLKSIGFFESLFDLEQHQKIQASSFTNSRDTLAAFKTDPSRFDLVITDMIMPHAISIHLTNELIALRADIWMIISAPDSVKELTKKKLLPSASKDF